MNDDAMDARILSQEHSSLELLARETHVDLSAVQAMFLAEYKRLAEHAHIRAYLPLLASHRVREILAPAIVGDPEDR